MLTRTTRKTGKSSIQHHGKDQPLDHASACGNCCKQKSCGCPGINLCGKTVLYVGGLAKLVPHYRQLVESVGGRFVHHDGGREISRHSLPKLVAAADAVLCPVDCVSHFACKCLKKACKRDRKPCVFMRSSSLSSFARCLGDIK